MNNKKLIFLMLTVLFCSYSLFGFAQTMPTGETTFHISPLEGKTDRFSIELRNMDLGDFFRVIAHDYKLNIMIDKDVAGTVTASFTDIGLQEALDKIAAMYGLKLETSGEVTIVKPDIVTKQFVLRNIRAQELLTNSSTAASGEQGQVATRASNIYDLLSTKGKILLGDQLNAIVVMDYQKNVSKVEEFISLADQKMAMKVIKLNYLSVKELFPDLEVNESAGRNQRRSERAAERNEIKEINVGAAGN